MRSRGYNQAELLAREVAHQVAALRVAYQRSDGDEHDDVFA